MWSAAPMAALGLLGLGRAATHSRLILLGAARVAALPACCSPSTQVTTQPSDQQLRLQFSSSSRHPLDWPAGWIGRRGLATGSTQSAGGGGPKPSSTATPEPSPPPPPASPEGAPAGGGNKGVEGEDQPKPSSSGRGEGAADGSSNMHGHFVRMGALNTFQPVLEKAEVEKAAGGLLSSGWPHLIDSPLQRLLSLAARPAVALREALLGRVYGRLEAISERMISEEVEEDYSGEDFLEGVKGAVGALYDAYAVLDVAALRAMASEKLVEAMQQAHGEVQRHAGHKLTGVTATVNRCAVRGVNLWGPESVGVFDRRWPAALTASTSKSWLVVTVAVDATLEAEYERAPLGGGAGSAGAGAEGGGYGGPARAVKSLVDRRGTWLFVRGPLPTGRSRSLHSSWFVLAWW